jgi:hypothetical protein
VEREIGDYFMLRGDDNEWKEVGRKVHGLGRSEWTVTLWLSRIILLSACAVQEAWGKVPPGMEKGIAHAGIAHAVLMLLSSIVSSFCRRRQLLWRSVTHRRRSLSPHVFGTDYFFNTLSLPYSDTFAANFQPDPETMMSETRVFWVGDLGISPHHKGVIKSRDVIAPN